MHPVCNFSDPVEWGPYIWYILDLMIVRLDPSNECLKNHILMQFVSLLEVIPCEHCRIHYQKFMTEHPIEPHLESKQALAKWVYDCRSSVNHRIPKSNFTFQQYLSKIHERFGCDLSDTRTVQTIYNNI